MELPTSEHLCQQSQYPHQTILTNGIHYHPIISLFVQIEVLTLVHDSFMGGVYHSDTIVTKFSYQHLIIILYIVLGQPGGGGSLYPASTLSMVYSGTLKNYIYT